MADSVLGLGPNLNAYRAALQQRSPQASTQTQQMVHMARDVARTLNAAFSNVPLPVTTSPTKRERDILTLYVNCWEEASKTAESTGATAETTAESAEPAEPSTESSCDPRDKWNI